MHPVHVIYQELCINKHVWIEKHIVYEHNLIYSNVSLARILVTAPRIAPPSCLSRSSMSQPLHEKQHFN